MTQAEATGLGWAPLAAVDPELWASMEAERRRQHDKIELIASENYTFAAVMEAQGSWLTNKYAEGLPGKRYYGGCEYVDVAETWPRSAPCASSRAREHVNVQPHSGAQANMAAYFSVLQPGDRILGMNLAHGGHLTHGSPVNFSGRFYEVHAYGVSPADERIDYDALARQAEEVRPKLIVAGASAYPRIIDFERMAAIAHGVGALLFVDMAHIAGLVAAGLHPSPFPHADLVTTTTHKTLRGPRGGLIFSRVEFPEGLDRADFPDREGHARGGRRQDRLPGHPGRPAHARHRRQGGRPAAGARRRLPGRPAPHGGERRHPGRCPPRAGRPARVGWHGQPPHAGRRDAPRGDRQGGRGEPRPRRHHREQERHPLRRSCRPTRHPASASARPPRRPAASGRPRCARSPGSSCVPSRPATTLLPRRCWRPSVRAICDRFPVPGLPAA